MKTKVCRICGWEYIVSVKCNKDYYECPHCWSKQKKKASHKREADKNRTINIIARGRDNGK